jgi:outer membrane protein assembly factor BamB
MTRTAKRRFSREITGIVDGIAFDPAGLVLVHHYDPPAGDMWIDDVIPGKLAALDRNTGELAWSSPCEVGYGRGFGAGFAQDGHAIVLGPTAKGHMLVRMSLQNGAFAGGVEIDTFDEALVGGELAITVTPKRVVAFETTKLTESW